MLLFKQIFAAIVFFTTTLLIIPVLAIRVLVSVIVLAGAFINWLCREYVYELPFSFYENTLVLYYIAFLDLLVNMGDIE